MLGIDILQNLHKLGQRPKLRVTCILALIRTSFNMYVNKQIICARLLFLLYWLTILRDSAY